MDFIPAPLRAFVQRLEINRAVGLILLSRLWQFASGFFTVVLISSYLDERTQGIYQVFISLVAMQTFVSLGLPGIASLLTSHEWAQLRFEPEGKIAGDPQALARLSSLVRWMSRWFLIGAGVFLVGVIYQGWREIGRDDLPADWQAPWVFYVLINAIALPYQPKLSILEGCHQVATVSYFRLWQAITGTLTVWVVLMLGGGLWALVASVGVRLLWEFYLVQVRYRSTFASLREVPSAPRESMGHEVWPLAWRVAIQTCGAYFSTYYFTLVVNKYQGNIEAGRFGMTWSILMTMQGAAQSWVDTRLPEYGSMASRGEFHLLRRRLLRTGLISVCVFLGGAGAYTGVVWALHAYGLRHAGRFLDLPSTGLLVTGLLLLLMSNILQISVRVYKRDPFVIPNTLSSLLIAVLVRSACQTGGSFRVALVYAGVIGLVSLPCSLALAIWNQQRDRHMPQS